MGPRGKREFVQVLRLLESFRLEEVHAAVQDALRLGALSFDAVKHLVLCRLEGRPPRLDLELYPHLPTVSVNTTSAGDCLQDPEMHIPPWYWFRLNISTKVLDFVQLGGHIGGV